ncbi:nucleotidyltransferase domain-containing protein [Ornithinibacillus contaminans]|uniref:nucleotidyltransferase domain-containing protein n=1 Tax=Ornithinibacillus contaminans TaxID=694055 RepID=UPI00064DD198|nr:hypothetical protein [Ornithinibacillus contaminans]
MLNTLVRIGKCLQNVEITWGVGGSLLLNFHQLIDKPNDIDILVDERNASRLMEIISPLGRMKEAKRSEPFRTVYFSKLAIEEVAIDIMGGFAISHQEGVYHLPLTADRIVEYKTINGVDIPLCALEDWYILYSLIPGKQEKAVLIENHFRTTGVKHPNLLEEALKRPLPQEVRGKIIEWLIEG